MARRCVDCGCRHDADGRRCPACSRPPLRADGGEDAAGSDVEGDDAEPFESIIWACPECGREHQRNSPPCSRCGNISLEKQQKVHADFETPGGTSYLDVLEPKYAVGYLAVVGFAVLVALSMAGVITLPGFGGPSPPGAPGDAETYANVSLASVEDAYVADLNAARAEREMNALEVDDALDGAATEFNQRLVRAATGDGDAPDMREILERYDPTCRSGPVPDSRTAAGASVFEGGTADAAADRLPIIPADAASEQVGSDYAVVGVDVHVAPDGTVFATVIFC